MTEQEAREKGILKVQKNLEGEIGGAVA